MDLRIRELMDELVERGHVDPIDMSIISQIMAVCMTGTHPDAKAAAERRAKDRDRKRASTENSTECPISKLDINSEGGVGETKTETPRNALLATLDAEHAEAVIEHRKRLRKPLTARAAKALAAEFAKATDPNAAADVMLARGWAGFEVGWLKNGKDPPKGSVVPYRPRPAPREYREIKAEREAKKAIP